MLDGPFRQPLFRSCLVYLFVWNPLLHVPYISSPNYYLHFTTHTHNIAMCFAVVPVLCRLFLLSLSISSSLGILTTVVLAVINLFRLVFVSVSVGRFLHCIM